jgi:hypothetical protein
MTDKTTVGYIILFFVLISCIAIIKLGVDKKEKNNLVELETQNKIKTLEINLDVAKKINNEMIIDLKNKQYSSDYKIKNIETILPNFVDTNLMTKIVSNVTELVVGLIPIYSPYADNCLIVRNNETVSINCRNAR